MTTINPPGALSATLAPEHGPGGTASRDDKREAAHEASGRRPA